MKSSARKLIRLGRYRRSNVSFQRRPDPLDTLRLPGTRSESSAVPQHGVFVAGSWKVIKGRKFTGWVLTQPSLAVMVTRRFRTIAEGLLLVGLNPGMDGFFQPAGGLAEPEVGAGKLPPVDPDTDEIHVMAGCSR